MICVYFYYHIGLRKMSCFCEAYHILVRLKEDLSSGTLGDQDQENQEDQDRDEKNRTGFVYNSCERS